MYENDKPTTVAYWVKLTLVALAMRMLAAFYLFLAVPQTDDPVVYARQAGRIMRGEAKGSAYFCPPGRSYCLIPFFLAFGESETTCRANAVTFDMACVLMAAVLAHQVLRRRSAARMTGWIAAFYPPAVMISGWCYSENVTVLGLLGCVCFALLGLRTMEKRGWWSLPAWILSGCFLGLTIVTRPSAFSVFFLAILGWIGFLALQRFRPGLVGAAARVPSTLAVGAGIVFSLATLACVAPTVAHHVALHEGWVVSINNEMNFYLGNNPFTPHYKTWHLGASQERALRIPGYKAYRDSVCSGPNPRSAMVHEAFRYIQEHPAIFLLRTANRIRAFWGFDHNAAATVRGAWSEGGKKTAFLLCLVAEGGGYCLTMLLVICGLFLTPGAMAKKDVALLIAVVLAYQLPYTLSFACGIYHFPVMGLLFPFAGLALDKAWREGAAFWQTIKGRVWLWVAVALFLLIQIEYACQVLAYEGAPRY
jgi:hypothetical protein